jgi:RES domain-containing protein
MKFKDTQLPLIEVPPGQIWHRVQLKRALKQSVRINNLVLAPFGGLENRFDLPDESVAYLADSPETALYERFFRRKVTSLHIQQFEKRVLISVKSVASLRLVDVRNLAEQYPVLVSERLASTQALAAACRQSDVHGILYASAQHPQHACVCLFLSGVARIKKVAATELLQPGTGLMHTALVMAARGSQIPILKD